ncbi:hypothetical protein [Pseudonocardia sp.]|uniref:hypothetical protein n=1 Tax=Pseudonocardia sp. TaxID=60912 RepID=UPI0031FC3CF2
MSTSVDGRAGGVGRAGPAGPAPSADDGRPRGRAPGTPPDGPSGDPRADPDDDVARNPVEDSGPIWLQEQIRRRMDANAASGTNNRHAREDDSTVQFGVEDLLARDREEYPDPEDVAYPPVAGLASPLPPAPISSAPISSAPLPPALPDPPPGPAPQVRPYPTPDTEVRHDSEGVRWERVTRGRPATPPRGNSAVPPGPIGPAPGDTGPHSIGSPSTGPHRTGPRSTGFRTTGPQGRTAPETSWPGRDGPGSVPPGTLPPVPPDRLRPGPAAYAPRSASAPMPLSGTAAQAPADRLGGVPGRLHGTDPGRRTAPPPDDEDLHLDLDDAEDGLVWVRPDLDESAFANTDLQRTDVGVIPPVADDRTAAANVVAPLEAPAAAPSGQAPSDSELVTGPAPAVAHSGTTSAPEQRRPLGARSPADDDLASKRVRVVLSERKGNARSVRTVVEVQEGTAVGDLLRTNLIGSQLIVALRIGAVAVIVLGLLPALFAVFPEIGQIEVLGIRLPWLLLGVLVYPFLLGLGWLHTRAAEKVEQSFADDVQD